MHCFILAFFFCHSTDRVFASVSQWDEIKNPFLGILKHILIFGVFIYADDLVLRRLQWLWQCYPHGIAEGQSVKSFYAEAVAVTLWAFSPALT